MPADATTPGTIILLLSGACIVLLVAGFRLGLDSSRLPMDARRGRVIRLTAALLAWMILVGCLSIAGFFSNFAVRPPRLLFAILTPAIALFLVNFRSRLLPAVLESTPVVWLLYLQVFRVVVELVLWRGYKAGLVPVQMTFEGRNFDIVAGLTAPLAAWVWKRWQSRVALVAWNLAGLLLLLNIVVVAILCMPTPLRLFHDGPANTLLTRFPFIYLPAVLVPIAYTAHFLSLKQMFLRRFDRQATGL